MPSVDNNTIRTAIVNLTIMGKRVKVEIPVPEGFVRPTALLPIFYNLADIAADIAVDAAQKQGRNLSCKKGCGACCRQLVPISEAEKHRLRDVVSSMPEPVQTKIRNRFTAIERRLESEKMLESLLDITNLDVETRHSLGRDYFRLGMPCPFLEDESCSIHSERPASCREYVVSSPAENCAQPTAENIEKISVPAAASGAAYGLGLKIGEKPRILPLSLAMFKAEADTEMLPINTADTLEKAFRSLGASR